MAYTTIDDPSAYFQIALYNGNNAANVITNDGNSDLQPDFLWMKERSSDSSHAVFDSLRGVGTSGKIIYPDVTAAEATSDGVTSFDTDGFTLASNNGFNQSGQTNVGWQWKANGGTTVSNTDGDYTSTVQANTTAGFSIVKYGDRDSFSAQTPATVGHGLGKAPKVVIIKNLDGARSWGVHHAGTTDAQKIIYLDATNAEANSSGFMNSTYPTSSVFTVNTLNVANGNNLEYIAYCFAEIQGYSKFGKYTGNGNADGPFIYTGFKPAWTMIKNIQTAGYNWVIQDTKRFGGINSGATDKNLAANSASAEPSSASFAGNEIDYLSNGFKLRSSAGNTNAAQSYIYMAFAESPFVSSTGTPTTAR